MYLVFKVCTKIKEMPVYIGVFNAEIYISEV